MQKSLFGIVGLVEALPDMVSIPIGMVDFLIFRKRNGGTNLMEM